MRSLDAVFEDATALFADASALMRRARGIRQELEAATATGADEASGSCTARSRPGSKPDSFRGSRRRSGGSGTRVRRPAGPSRPGSGNCWMSSGSYSRRLP
jgi:hypothetical protein